MNDSILRPANEAELVDAIRGHQQISPCGNRTKPAMSSMSRDGDTAVVSLSAMSGVVEYEPSEFTFTALAGTRIDEINSVLAERNQYLPFDPMLVRAGATIGGTVAAGLSGPGRFRFGGLRDFIIGCTFVSGDGKMIRSGGKVVKNAAGFDIPKLMVGSLGRLGVISELTFKVFPKPASTLTLVVKCESNDDLNRRISEAAASQWEFDAIDSRRSGFNLYLRLAGPPQVNQAIAAQVSIRWGDDVGELDSSDSFWQSVTELTFAGDHSHVVKVPASSQSFFDFDHHASAAGNVVWVATNDVAFLSERLTKLELTGLVVRGQWQQAVIGKIHQSQLSRNIKAAMDPKNRFGE
ncbi:MAG: FAD-binding protein [Rubripirellula sp.]